MKKHIQRQCQRVKNNLKKDYVEMRMDRHRNDPKKLWQAIREFWPSSKKSAKSFSQEKYPVKILEMCEKLNEHFTSVGAKIQEKIDLDVPITDYIPVHHPPIFDLHSVALDDVCEAINKFIVLLQCRWGNCLHGQIMQNVISTNLEVLV